MTAAPVQNHVPSADVNGVRYYAAPNPRSLNSDGSTKSWMDQVVSFLNESFGTFYSVQLFDRVSSAAGRVLEEMGSSFAGYFKELSQKFETAWSILVIPSLPSVTYEAMKSLSGRVDDARGSRRQSYQDTHNISEAASSWLYVGSLFCLESSLKNAGDVFNLVSDYTDLAMAHDDWSLAKDHLSSVNSRDPQNGALQQRFQDTMKYALLKMVKSVASVASGAFGLLVLTLGGPNISAAFLLCLGLLTTVSAISAHFFKSTCRYDIVDFYKFEQPQTQVASFAAN